MTRIPYKIKEEEIEILINGIMDHGEEETYSRMKEKSLYSMASADDMDEKLMDMHETVLQRAREMKDNDEDLESTLYVLASIFRILAHDIYREYKKKDTARDSERFLRLVSYNADAPKTQ